MSSDLEAEIREALHSEIKGFLAFPDDIDVYVMPSIRDAIDRWKKKTLAEEA